MLSCGHFFAKVTSYKSPGWITFCLFKVKINNIEMFISTSCKLDVIVFGIQFHSQYCRRSRWIFAKYFQNEENRPLSIAAHIRRMWEWSLIMPGRVGGGGGRKPIILSKNFILHWHSPPNFHAPINCLEIFSCPNRGVWFQLKPLQHLIDRGIFEYSALIKAK